MSFPKIDPFVFNKGKYIAHGNFVKKEGTDPSQEEITKVCPLAEKGAQNPYLSLLFL